MKNISLGFVLYGLFALNVARAASTFDDFNGTTNGLVAFYPFTGNVKDESGNGNDGVANNVNFAPDRFGLPNRAASFAGTKGSNVKINSTNLNLQPDFTLSVWINYTAGAGTEGPRIISTAGYEIGTESPLGTDRRISFNNTFSSSSGNVWSYTRVLPGVWTHIVGVRDSNTLNLYIKGSLAGVFFTTLPPNYSREGFVPTIGGNSGAADSDFYRGLIDDLRIYNRALSAPEVQQLYQDETQS